MAQNSEQGRSYLKKYHKELAVCEEFSNIEDILNAQNRLTPADNNLLIEMQKYDGPLYKCINKQMHLPNGAVDKSFTLNPEEMARDLVKISGNTVTSGESELYLEIRDEIAQLYRRESNKEGKLENRSELYEAWRRKSGKKGVYGPTLFKADGRTPTEDLFCYYADISNTEFADMRLANKPTGKKILLKICIALSWGVSKTRSYLEKGHACFCDPQAIYNKKNKDCNRDLFIAVYMKFYAGHYHVSDMKEFLNEVNGFGKRHFDPLYK